MQKQAPSLGRILTMVLFALSCFGLLLFLWLSFGGPVPLKPQGYQVKVSFPEATQLGLEADVRVSGVTVGKVRKKELDPDGNRTLATLEIEKKFAPVHTDARAILRQKTLLGETYVEMSSGTPGTATVKEGGSLDDGQVENSVELDEIFQALDPVTRKSFQTWQQDLAVSVEGRGGDLNDAFGSLPEFAADGTDLLKVLNTQEGAVSALVKNTGEVFAALTEDEGALRNLITNSESVFSATASQNERLAESIRIFPTFLRESRTTLRRLQTFARETDPLILDLTPATADLADTLPSVRRLSPDLERLFRDLDPLIDASEKGLPATTEFLAGLKPVLGRLGPFLGELNPVLQWLELHQRTTSDFFNGSAALADTTSSRNGVGHYLRQFGPLGAESLGMYPQRLGSNRGNAYIPPVGLATPESRTYEIFPNFDCPGGTKKADADSAGCFVQPNPPLNGKAQGRYPHVEANDYSGN